jgi:hypothetical protein
MQTHKMRREKERTFNIILNVNLIKIKILNWDSSFTKQKCLSSFVNR